MKLGIHLALVPSLCALCTLASTVENGDDNGNGANGVADAEAVNNNAGDAAPEAAAAIEDAIEEDSPWSYKLRFGAFVNQTASRRAGNSRDSVISSSEDAISYRLSLDGNLTWAEGANELKQDLRLRYGRIREDSGPWRTNSDEIRYDIIGYHFLDQDRIHFLYLAGRAETVFEGPKRSQVLVDPLFRNELQAELGLLYDEVPLSIERSPRALTPGTAYVAAGYGQRRKDIFLPESDQLEVRAGVRAQRRWGDLLPASQKEVKVGVEVVLDYRNTINDDIEWYFHAESFAPFDDLGHITSWAETGIEINITRYIMASISARFYYETDPKDIDKVPGDGYNSLSLRQEALIGFTYKL